MLILPEHSGPRSFSDLYYVKHPQRLKTCLMDFDYLMTHPWRQRVTTNLGHYLRQFPAALLVSRPSFAFRTDGHISQLSMS